jgi:hypothetical protein
LGSNYAGNRDGVDDFMITGAVVFTFEAVKIEILDLEVPSNVLHFIRQVSTAASSQPLLQRQQVTRAPFSIPHTYINLTTHAHILHT